MSDGIVNSITKNLGDYKLPITSGVVGVVIGLLSKNVLKKETIRVSSMSSTLVSFVSIAAGTIVAEQIIMEKGRE